jgi:chorismate mutase
MAHDFTEALDKIRTGIDEVDNGIVKLLARRRELVFRLIVMNSKEVQYHESL